VLAAALLVAGACGDDDDAATTPTTEATDSTDGAGGGSASAADITVEGGFGEAPTFDIPAGLEVTELVTEDLVVGDGEEVPEGATVTVDYAGVFLDGSEFDSSFSRGQPATFPLSGVIEGWTEGIPGMRVGGRRLLVIPSELAYGAAGRPGIPPDSPLVFVVDMVATG
jgi:peptidylprolyl isomerase